MVLQNICIQPKRRPVLDPDFVPASLWNREFQRRVAEEKTGEDLATSLERPDGAISLYSTRILPHQGPAIKLNLRYVERLVKFLLWAQSGYRVTIAGNAAIARALRRVYAPDGARQFDYRIVGHRIFGHSLEIRHCPFEAAPAPNEKKTLVGGNMDGCRVGIDLGGTDRKCAAVMDGRVLFSEEVRWDPYVQKDPAWHRRGIQDSFRRAANALPRVDAVGVSAAGIYFQNRVCLASLFRGVSEENFDQHVRNLFLDLQREWGRIPMLVVNDGNVSALAGALGAKATGVLGIAMGTCLAAGYVTVSGHLTDWMNELSFCPLDYREDAPVDEWSGDRGCGAQYFSQQAVARLAPAAGLDFLPGMPLADRLIRVQELMAQGDARAMKIYQTIGGYLGYGIAHYAEFYRIKGLTLLGRVMTGPGGDVVLKEAQQVLREEFPELAAAMRIHVSDETMKRHGQAVAAASLPVIQS